MRPPTRKTVLLAATMVVLLIAVPVALLRLPYATRFVLQRAQAYLRDQYGVALTAAQVHMDLGRGFLAMSGVQVRSLAAPDLPPLLQLDHAFVNLGIWRTLTGALDVQSTRLDGLAINVVFAPDGRNNLPTPRQTTRFTGLPEFHMASLSIERGSFRLQDPRSGIDLDLPSWSLAVAGQPPGWTHRVVLRSGAPGMLRVSDAEMKLDQLDLAAVLDRTAVQIDRFAARVDESPVEIRGGVSDFADPRLDLKVEAASDMARVGAILELRQRLSGPVRTTAHVTGGLRSPGISGQVLAGPLAAAGYDQLDTVLDFAWAGNTRRLVVTGLNIKSPHGTISARGSIGLNEGELSSLEGRLESWDLRPLADSLTGGTELASLASGTFSASWPGLDFTRMAGRSDFRLTASRSSPLPHVLPLSGAGRVEVKGKRVNALIREAAVLGSRISGQLTMGDGQRLAGALRADIPAVDALQSQLVLFLGRRAAFVSEPLGGSANVEATVAGTLGKPELAGKVVSDDFRMGGLHDVSVYAEATANPANVLIRQALVRSGNQVLEGTGTLGLRGRDPAVSLDLRVTQGSIPALVAAAGFKMPAEGGFEARARLGGTVQQMSGELHVSAAGLTLYGEPLGNLAVDATVSGNVIRTTRLELQKVPGDPGSGLLDGNGSYDLASGVFSFDVQGRNIQVQSLTLPGGTPVEGTFALSATGSGTSAEPAIDLKIDAPDLRARRELQSVSLVGHLRGKEARFEAAIPLLKAALVGQIHTAEPYPGQLRLDLNDTDLSLLQIPVANEETLAGAVSATITAAGDLDDWKAGQATATIRTLRLIARNHELHNEGPVEANYKAGRLTVEPSRLAIGSSTLDISGTIPIEPQTAEGELSLRGAVQLGDIYPFFRSEEGFFVNGIVKLDAMLRGSPKKMQASGAFAMTDGFLHTPQIRMPFTDIAIEGRLENGSLALSSAKAQYGSSQISFSGDVPLGLLPNVPFEFERRQGPARFELALLNLTLESTGELPSGITGVVDLHAKGELARPALDAVNAVATVDRLQFRVDEVPFEQSAPSVIEARNGTVNIGSITLQGPETVLRLGGSAALTGDRRLDLHLNGDIDAGIFTVLTKDLRATGDTHLELSVGGTMSDPQLGGTVELRGGQANLKSLNIGADSLQARLTLSNNRITVDNISGFLNGGVLQGGGTVGYNRLDVTDVNLNARMEGVYLEIPEGLRTVVNANLNLRSTDYPIAITGRVDIQEGAYRKPFDLTGGLLSGFTANLTTSQAIDIGQQRNPLLSRVRYDVTVRATNPIIVDNNVAKLAARANLRLVGSYYRPSVVGRANFEEGGEIRLNERQYVLERGAIQFLNESRIEPVLDMEARTQVSPYDITVQISGNPNNLRTTLTSDPPAPEPDLLSMLLTGRTQEEFRGQELAFAKEQAMSLLAGTAGQRISGAAQKTLGFSTVRLEPSLISPEQDPGARLTVGQNITENLSLIYSMNLVNSNDQIWIAEYDVTRRFVTRGLMQGDNTYRFEFQHDVRFGGAAGTGRVTREDRTKREIGKLSFEGNTALTNEQLQSRLKLKPGNSYDFFKVQNGRDRLKQFFADQGRLESKIVIKRDASDGKVDLGFTLTPGPTVRFFFEGYNVSGKVREQVAKIWEEGIFDLQRADDAVQEIRRPLVEEGYLQSVVRYSIQRQGDSKEVHFTINPGIRFSGVETVFRGNSEVPASELKEQLRAANLETQDAVFNNPAHVAELIKNYYRLQGFLEARVDDPKPELNPQIQSGQVVIAIKEGPRFKVGKVTIEGNTVSEERIRSAAALKPGEIFAPQTAQNALDRLDQLFHTLGYNDATVTFEPFLNSATGTADIKLHVDERRQEVIKQIDIQGNHESNTRFVRRQLGISEGDVFNYDKIAAARKALYDTGVFTLVDMDSEPLEPAQQSAGPNQKPVKLVLRLREIRPYRLRYGGFYDTDRGPGFTADLERRNLLGKAALVGMHSRYDGTVKELRSYYSQPFIGHIPLRTTLTVYAQRESRPGYLVDRFGASLMQQKRLKSDYLLDYGYRYEQVRAPNGLPDPLLRIAATVPVAKLLTSITRDTRDDILDATHGSFVSHGLVYAPGFLGSEARFIKYFGQYFRYIPLAPPKVTNGVTEKARFVYAGALRVGLAKGLGGNEVITPERFFAGGGTTLRGFRQDAVGPTDPTGRPRGGEGMFLLNNEVRVPLFKLLDGVGFVDIGNIYRSVRDFNPFDVRKSAGIGIRIRTGYVVLRLDYGLKLDRKPGESRGALFFSIGQAY